MCAGVGHGISPLAWPEAEVAAEVRDAYEADRAEMVRRRIPGAAGFFVVSIAAAAVVDRLTNPERSSAVTAIFGAQVVLSLAAVGACYPKRIARFVEAVGAAFAVALSLLANLYLLIVGAPLEHLTVASVCFLAGGAVLLPWSWQAQLVVSLSIVTSYLVAAPALSTEVGYVTMALNVAVIATLMVMATYRLDRYRFEAFLRSATEAEEAQVRTALARMSETLHARLRDPAMLEHSNRLALELLGCDWSATYLWIESLAVFRLRSLALRSGLQLDEDRWADLLATEFARDSLPLVGALELGEPIEIQDDTNQPFVPATTMRRFAFSSALLTPVVEGTTVRGVLVHGYVTRTGPFSRAQRRIAEGVAHVTAIALDNAHLIDQLTAANRLKTEFVATMSHELRTPLNVITGYTDLLDEGAFGSLTSEQRDIVGRVRQSAFVLLELVNTTLALGRLEAGREPLALGEVRLADVMGEVAREQEALAPPEVTLAWHVDPAVAVLSDRSKVKTILKNLVGNALKFTKRGQVDVEAAWHEGVLRLVVRDTGVGIAKDQLDIVFDMFRQVDGSPTRRFGGVGLGLHIVKRLTELLGGGVSVESEIDRGTRFLVRIPCQRLDDVQTERA
jgi:signal transduction histidine kinase